MATIRLRQPRPSTSIRPGFALPSRRPASSTGTTGANSTHVPARLGWENATGSPPPLEPPGSLLASEPGGPRNVVDAEVGADPDESGAVPPSAGLGVDGDVDLH